MDTLRMYFHLMMPNASEDEIEATVLRVWSDDDEYIDVLNHILDEQLAII